MFSASNVTLKMGYVNLVSSWNTSMPFNTIIYDRKFVDLLMGAISGKRSSSVLTKKQTDFVKGMYLLFWIPPLDKEAIVCLQLTQFIFVFRQHPLYCAWEILPVVWCATPNMFADMMRKCRSGDSKTAKNRRRYYEKNF